MCVANRCAAVPAFLLAASTLSACGTVTPSLQTNGPDGVLDGPPSVKVVERIECDLRSAVKAIFISQRENRERLAREGHPEAIGNSPEWLRKWGAQISLKVSVDDKSSLSPGLTITKLLPNGIVDLGNGATTSVARSGSAALGASFVAQATHVETVTFFYPFSDFLETDEALERESCGAATGTQLDSDLRLSEFLWSKMPLAQIPGLASRDGSKAPFSTFTYQATFVVTRNASVTPSWKLARVAINPSGAFASAQRARTDDVTITLGPKKDDGGPSEEVKAQHNAKLIGEAVRDALRGQ